MLRRFGVWHGWLLILIGLSTNTYSRNEMFILGAAFSPGLHSAGQSAARASHDGLPRGRGYAGASGRRGLRHAGAAR